MSRLFPRQPRVEEMPSTLDGAHGHIEESASTIWSVLGSCGWHCEEPILRVLDDYSCRARVPGNRVQKSQAKADLRNVDRTGTGGRRTRHQLPLPSLHRLVVVDQQRDFARVPAKRC
jgi:hypothetical protein